MIEQQELLPTKTTNKVIVPPIKIQGSQPPRTKVRGLMVILLNLTKN